MAANTTYKNWTTEEDNLLRKVAAEGIEYKDICQKYFPDRTASSLQSRASKLNLKSSHRYRKNFFDESFWDIPNLLNSFWAGTMAADGNVGETDGVASSLNWEISIVDLKYMEKFNKDTKHTGVIRNYIKTNRSGSVSKMIKIGIYNKKWIEKLGKNFNVTPRKANRVSIPDNFSHELKMAWLIGYINGDGCIHLSKKCFYQNQWQQRLSIGFTSASFDIIKWITDFSNNKFNPKRKKLRKMRTTQGVNPYYHITVGGQPAVQMFIYLSQFNVPILERKWRDETILNFIKEEYLKSPAAYNDYIWDQNSFIVDFLNGGPTQ